MNDFISHAVGAKMMAVPPNEKDRPFLPEVPTPWILRSRKRLFLTFFITLALPMGLFLFLLSTRIGSYFQTRIMAQNQEAARFSAEVIDGHIRGLTTYAELFSTRLLLIKAIEENDAEAVQKHLKDFVTYNPYLTRAFVTNPVGIELYDYPNDPTVIGKDFSYRDWFQGVQRTEKTYVSEVYQRAATPRIYVIAIGTPIKNATGEIIAYLSVQISAESLLKTLAENRSDSSSSLLVIDHHGFLTSRIHASDGAPLALGKHPLFQQMAASKSGTIKALNPVSKKMSFMGYQMIPKLGWLIVACQTADSVLEPVKKLHWMVMGFALPAFAMMFIFGILWINSIAHYHRIRRHAEQIIIQKTDQLARSETEREQMKVFAFAATHDLQEPLHKILTFANMLKTQPETPLASKGLYYLECVQSAAERMSHMMEKLREMARITSGKDTLEKVDLPQLIRQILDEIRFSSADGKNEIQIGHIPILRANPLYMQVLFRNLIENALKFRKDNSVLSITIESRLLDNDFIEITVKDNGLGFDNQYAEYIFEPFKRLHTRETYSGSGMGLTLCRAIVKHHQGTITATGILGEGAVFTITLPLSHKEIP
jgi:signal transduction histidine kinase